MHEHANSGAVEKYQAVQLRGARKFLQCLLREGDGGDVSNSVRRSDFLSVVVQESSLISLSCRHLGEMLVDISYALTSAEDVDKFIRMADNQARNFSVTVAPGKYMVDVLPWCKSIIQYVIIPVSRRPTQ
jgi:hypothetical protein